MSPSRRAPGKPYVGCSGWSYPHWVGILYDPARPRKEWFAQYAERFSTVEVNNTFYRLPEPSTFRAWAAQAPRDFTYALKLSQYGTHRQKLRGPERWLPVFVERAQLLGPTLGPNLVQLPPRWRLDADRLEEFLEVAKTIAGGAPKTRWAVEFRDPSWLDERTYQVLRRYNAALCVHDLLPDHPWLLTADWAYARFHGPTAQNANSDLESNSGEKYLGDYGPQRLAGRAQTLRSWLDQGCDVYAYFNNDLGGAAVRDAAWLSERLTS